MKPAHDACAVSLLLSSISTGVPEDVQVSVVGLATMIIARDINACEQAILENQYHDGVVVDGDKPFFLWRTFADLVSSRKRDLQKATARFLNTLFWRLPQDTIELTTKPRGQSSEEYWMLPRLLDALGHPDDEAVEDLLQVLSPLASSVQAVKKEDLEEEFAHLVFVPQNTLQRERETPAQRLLREAAGMISDGERVSVCLPCLVALHLIERQRAFRAVRDETP
ncbi:yki [Symbiodinium sp. CCMP2592]|nr:yki [Symbiodinium sp. CCMP2592]